jgi:hypothetical protein
MYKVCRRKEGEREEKSKKRRNKKAHESSMEDGGRVWKRAENL